MYIYIYMATAPLIHARYVSSPRIANRRNGSQQGPSSSTCCSSSYANYAFNSGTNREQGHQSLGAQAMSTTTPGNSIARSTTNLKNDPDHLLVLVHGIMARYIYTNCEENVKLFELLFSNLSEVA